MLLSYETLYNTVYVECLSQASAEAQGNIVRVTWILMWKTVDSDPH